jgi:hypothetical protein
MERDEGIKENKNERERQRVFWSCDSSSFDHRKKKSASSMAS